MKKLLKTSKPKVIKSISKDILKNLPFRAKKSTKLSPIMQELVKAREASGMTKTQLADKMDEHLGQIVIMENGKTKSPSIALLQAYAKAVGGEVVMEFKKKVGKK